MIEFDQIKLIGLWIKNSLCDCIPLTFIREQFWEEEERRKKERKGGGGEGGVIGQLN